MKLYDAITAGITHLFQNWLRAGLSILGIFIGVASVLCMIAIGDGAKLIIADDLEKLGGANQVKFRTLKGVWKGRHLIRPTTERYTLEDAYAIEAECRHVLFAFPKIDRYQASVTSQYAGQARLSIEGVTANYAQGMHWDVQHGRFLKENDTESARKLTHARILLKADTGELGPAYTDKQIKEAVEVSISTIERTRKTFALEGLEAALTAKKRPEISKPRKFDGEKEAHLIALACSEAPEGHTRWTLRLLAEKMVDLKHFSSISHESIREVLKKTHCDLG